MKIIKNITVVFLCFMVLSGQHFVTFTEEVSAAIPKVGDVNGDGQITALDYVILKKYLDGKRDIDDSHLDRCDTNGDGNIDQYDSQTLRSMVYYGEVDNMNISVESKTIHTDNQRKFLEAGHDSIKQYGSGGAASKPVVLEYDSSIISSGSRYTIMVSENPNMSDAKTYTSTSRTVSIDNSKVQQLYFWTVSNGSRTSDVQAFYVEDVPVRNLSTGTIGNARDIGGFETEDGYIVKQGMIYRGHMMSPGSNLSKNRDILINDLGIQTEIDIKEKQSDSSIYYDTSVLNSRPNQDFDHYLRRYLKFDIANNYISKPNYESWGNIRKIFDDLADESRYPIYIHCRIGADRTGLMCFLFNALCGVSKEDCYKDYVFTTYSGDARTAAWISSTYVQTIENTEGRSFAEKTYNLLVKRGVNPDSLDSFISIMKEKKPENKTYLELPEAIETTLHYDGDEKVLMLKDNYMYNISGNKARDVGDYIARVSLKDPYTYSWADGSKSDKYINWNIEDVRESVALPVPEISEYVYDGQEKEIIVDDKEYYEVSGNKGTDAGEYEMVFSLTDKSKYVWEDDSNADLTYKWTIQKADVDVSMISFADTSFTYDGTEKALVYEGELPEGISAVTYKDNVLLGSPYKASSTEATMSFVLESDNYNPVEDMKAVLTVEPVYSDLIVDFDAQIDPISVRYGEAYTLPELSKEGYTFDGWYLLLNDEYIKVESSGIWEYEVNEHEVTLIPLFTYDEEVTNEVIEDADSRVFNLNIDDHDGIAQLVESDVELDGTNMEYAQVIGLYQMKTNGSFEVEKNDEQKYYYLILDNNIVYDFN